MLTEKEKVKRKNQKKLKSFRNKMGSNIVWFDSLTNQEKYDLMFEWERERYYKRNITVPVKTKKKVYALDRNYRRIKKDVEVINYPANLKFFIRDAKNRYNPKVSSIREATIDILLGK
jgi:hypothetical protein